MFLNPPSSFTSKCNYSSVQSSFTPRVLSSWWDDYNLLLWVSEKYHTHFVMVTLGYGFTLYHLELELIKIESPNFENQNMLSGLL